MTLNYLSGEVSLRLADLGYWSTDPGIAARVAELRLRSERCAPHELMALVPGIFEAIDDLCWCALAEGKFDAFDRQVGIARDFAEFARAARLMLDGL